MNVACGHYLEWFSICLQHDTTVAAVMSALGVYSGIQPPYASAFMIELFSEKGLALLTCGLNIGSFPLLVPMRVRGEGEECRFKMAAGNFSFCLFTCTYVRWVGQWVCSL